MISFQDHEAVLVLADERHFGRAAARLQVSQPALTARLRRLEDLLGVRLFDRGRAGVTPTAAGLAFCQGAQRVLDATADVVDSVRRAGEGVGVTLRIGMTQIAAHKAVIPSLTRFRAAHPKAGVTLVESTTVSLERDLEQGRLDAAFLHPPLHVPGLSQHSFGTIELVCSLVGQGGDRQRPVRYPLNEAPVLMAEIDRSGVPGKADILIGPPVEANTVISALALSAAGYGPAFVPADFPDFGLERENALSDGPTSQLETSLAWRADDRRPALRAFVDAARAPGSTEEEPNA
ncbi:MAG: LysR family transcriptional regulator [Pseudomonadota bacterium]